LWLAGALVMLAAGGHAAGADPAWYGITLDAVHLIAAGLWAGGIAALAAVRPPGGWRSTEARPLLNRFTPVALAAFAATVVAGGLEAITQLGSIQALFNTAYGRVLLVKMVLVACMLPLSAMAWRLKRPRVRVEAALAAGVVAAAALLASFPTPPTAAARHVAEVAASTPALGLPARGELTMAGSAGSVLVGLSLSPGTPGPNRATVYVLPVAGGTVQAQGLAANIAVNGVYQALVPCGATCRRATIDIKAGDQVWVEVLNSTGGRATFVIPQLPAPPGDDLLTKLEAAMNSLTAYQVSEVLNSGTVTVHGVYASQAPDRTTWTINNTGTTIWIGTTQYTRDAPGQPWHRQTSPVNTVPSYVWDYFKPLTNAHVIGREMLGGVPTTVVASFGNSQSTPIWFTFWIDGAGRVRRVAMDAPGHFMTDTYTSYNKPVDIVAPKG
jgi:uncharacterized membrane protein